MPTQSQVAKKKKKGFIVVTDVILLGSKIRRDADCSHIKKNLFVGKKMNIKKSKPL